MYNESANRECQADIVMIGFKVLLPPDISRMEKRRSCAEKGAFKTMAK